ncbi:MAG: PD-(D/E)XK nuclease family protein [Candidatus Krumholzibacteriota bacterium]|nr:PD-(D/E)XK nuclease family protein [Candidatus Krumholzibacteriota bacterium]
MYGKVITGRGGSLLEKKFIEKIVKIRAEEGPARIDILTGSNQLGEYLKRRLAEESQILFNIDFITFPDLIKKIIDRSRPGSLVSLPPFAWKVIIEGIISSSVIPESFRSIADTGGFSSALSRTFTDLAESGISGSLAAELSEDQSLKRRSRRVADLLSVYSKFRERIEEAGGDMHSWFSEAADIVDRNGYDTVTVAYGFYDFNQEQWNLISSIARQGRILLFVPFCDEEQYSFAGRLIDRSSGSGLEIERAAETPCAKTGPIDAGLLSMRNDEEEYREIARKIISFAGSGDYRFDEMEIILLPGTDKNLIADIFDEAEIPFYLKDSHDTGSSSIARGVLSLIGLLNGRIRRTDLVEFFSSAPVDISGRIGCGTDLIAVWIRKSAEAGMTGEGGWVDENRILLEKISNAVKRGMESEEAVSAVKVVGELIEKIVTARGYYSLSSTWSDFAGHFSSLISGIFPDTEDMLKISLILESLAGLDRLSGKVPAGLFFSILRDTIDSAAFRSSNKRKRGIPVLSPGEARGLRAKVIFIPSLTEGSIPGKIRQDPFLKDSDRTMLEEIAPREILFSKKSERIDEQILLFSMICDSASDKLVCSRPRTESGTGRDKIESSFVRFLRERFAEGSDPSSLLEMRIPGTVRSIDEIEPLSENEFDMILLASDRAAGIEAISNRFFSRGRLLSSERWQADRLTPYDAVFRSSEALSESKKVLEEKNWSFSATSLECWARCPYLYFLENMLGVRSVSEPERILTIDRTERGRLVHSLLEDLFRRLGEEGYIPLSRASRKQILKSASLTIEKILNRYQEEQPVGLAAFWEMEKEWARKAVIRYVEGEMENEDDMKPERFEEYFGENYGSPVSFRTKLREIFFHGRIDRIDRGGNDRFRVVDYKTGGLKGKDDDIAGGTFLQLPVYLLGAAELLGMTVESGTALYQQITPEGRASVTFSGINWKENRDVLSDALDLIISGIEKGYFFIYPDRKVCRYCEMKEACPSARETLFSRKSKNNQLWKDFLALRGRDVDEDA